MAPDPAVLSALHIYLEDPCGPKPCPLDPVPCKCESCRAGKACGNSLLPPIRWCSHILELWEDGVGIDFPIEVGDAADLFSDRDGEYEPASLPWDRTDFREPALAPLEVVDGEPQPVCRSTREQALQVYNERANIQRADDPPLYALRRPDDIRTEHVDGPGEKAVVGKTRSELVTTDGWERLRAARAAEKAYQGSLDLLAAKAVKDTGDRGKALLVAFDRAAGRYRQACERLGAEQFATAAKKPKPVFVRLPAVGSDTANLCGEVGTELLSFVDASEITR